jgi:lysylphosphatidylglycerol synthetase-like protein (DUF2156 family)
MKSILRMALAALLGILAWVVMFFLFSFLVVWSAWPHSWRVQHPDLVLNTSRILAVTPCVIALGVAFNRLFRAEQTLHSIAAMTIALVVVSALTVFPPGSVAFVVLPLLLGPAFIVYVMRTHPGHPRQRPDE